jgi:hypothetical protein
MARLRASWLLSPLRRFFLLRGQHRHAMLSDQPAHRRLAHSEPLRDLPHRQALAAQLPDFGYAVRWPRAPPRVREVDARAGGYRPDHLVAQTVLGADGAQREAGADTLDDGTIAGLELRGACG